MYIYKGKIKNKKMAYRSDLIPISTHIWAEFKIIFSLPSYTQPGATGSGR
jgi:hypothetical protein